MRPTKVQCSPQNAAQTHCKRPKTLQEAYARDTPHGKGSQKWKETTADIALNICPIQIIKKGRLK